jgi:protein involved in polysaccharide export with SLBB domain
MPRIPFARCALVFLGALLAALATSCSVTPPSEINEIYRDVLEQRRAQYRIKDGDTLVLKLYSPQHADLNQSEILVRPDGKTDLFFMDNYQAAGKTLPEIEAELKARVATQVRDPEISIQIKPRGEKIYMVGQFLKPAPLDLTTGMTLQEAISAVGGTVVTGDTDYALLRRPCMNPRKPDLFRIDLNDETEEIVLLPGDQIYCGRNAVGTVVHYIQQFILSIFPTPYYWLMYM